MTTTSTGFLSAIIADPGDDSLRLIYADWLAEHGGQPERAEFVRCQLELSTIRTELYLDPSDPDDQKIQQRLNWLREQQDDLMRSHAWKWMRDTLPPLIYQEYDRWRREGPTIGSKREDNWSLTFRRGFVEEIQLDAATWLTHSARLIEASPIRTVRLTTTPEQLLEFRQSLWHGVDPDERIVRLPGRPWRSFPDGDTPEERILNMLADEWKGITFHLPG